jgi:two-component system OmpR family sensor kinase
VVQAWGRSRRPLYASPPALALPRFPGEGFDTVSALGERWRIFRELRHGLFVQIAQPTSVREEFAADLALQSLAPFVFLIPLLAVMIVIVVYRSLRPLRWLAKAVAQRSPDALQSLADENLPPEVRPIVHSLNHLLTRLNKALDAQRAFVADAAHELRSPLIALKLQLQLAERARTDGERIAAFARLHQLLDRSARLLL